MHPTRVLPKLAALFGVALAAILLTAGAVSAQDYDPYDPGEYDPCDAYDGTDGYDPPEECVDETTTSTTTTTTTTTTNASSGGSALPQTGGIAMVGTGVALAAGAIAVRRMTSAA